MFDLCVCVCVVVFCLAEQNIADEVKRMSLALIHAPLPLSGDRGLRGG